MRGLMADPTGRTIEIPIKANFREGLTVLEYFISTHGTRKGLADTALRTADSGYLTRRLVDVAQDVIVREEDCGTDAGDHGRRHQRDPGDSRGGHRTAAGPDRRPRGGRAVVAPRDGRGHGRRKPDDRRGDRPRHRGAGIEEVDIRSVLTCRTRLRRLRPLLRPRPGHGQLVEVGEAVGIIAAQSIGEPGTQLTMRTFHTGGVAASKTSPRVCRGSKSSLRPASPRARRSSPRSTASSRSWRPRAAARWSSPPKTARNRAYTIPYGARLKVRDGRP